MDIYMQDIDKRSLFKRVLEKESAGYECICPITPKRTVCKDYSYKETSLTKYKASGLSQFTMYYVKMRKPE